MKNIFVLLLSTMLGVVAHAETRTMAKVDANHASVKIVQDNADGVQAAVYVDGQENQKFIEMLLADPTSELAKIKYQMESEACDAHSTPENSWIPGCGEVEVTDGVMTSFGRGGWMEAGAGYTMFVGFRESGTGHFFESDYMILIGEDVSADVDDKGEYLGSLTKSLSLSKVTKLPKEQ